MHLYVFRSDGDHIGLTMTPDGSNLPNVVEGGAWKPHGVVAMTAHDIGRFTTDTRGALSNLKARGYHLIQCSRMPRRFRS